MDYTGFVTRIKNIRPHSNADRLNVGTCFGNSVIVSLETEEEELGLYFPTDGQLGVEYCETNNLLRKKDASGKNIGGYLEPNIRHVRALKLRGEISDGLFMPLESLSDFTNVSKLKEGDLISVLNGVEICKKYIPVMKMVRSQPTQPKNKIRDTISYPMFAQHGDTTQLVYNLHQFEIGDVCYMTLKMHGTSGRTGFLQKEDKKYYKGIKKLFSKTKFSVKKTWEYITGTRRTIRESFEGGYYGDDSFREVHHKKFVDKLQKGEIIYYEIVGYHAENSPIMGTVSNEKTKDKEFIKIYGDTTTYSYGCDNGKSDIYIYRITMTNEDGYKIDYPWGLVQIRAEQLGLKTVMELDRFIFTTEEDLVERVAKHSDGVDPIGKTHIREGVVVRIEGKDSFKAFKHKNFNFKCLEGIVKDAGIVDIEEQEEIKGE